MASTVTRTPPTTSGGAASPWRHVDLSLVAAVLALASFGLVMIYSATRTRLDEAGSDPQYYLQRQALFVALGIGVMLVTSVIDYRTFRDFAALIYAGTVGMLMGVVVLGAEHKGQQASFDLGPFQLQPSEFAKVSLIVCLAAYVSSARGDLDGRRMLTVLGLAGVPMGLIYLQPDLGTSLVFGAILLGMLLVSGAQARHLVALLLVAVIAVVAVVNLGVLKDYQYQRLTSFLEPESDTGRSSYNLAQSKTAIGSGGVAGKGLFKGSQTNLSYVPEQHTDFIFTAVGEQLGLIGSALLLAVFALVAWRTWRAAALARRRRWHADLRRCARHAHVPDLRERGHDHGHHAHHRHPPALPQLRRIVDPGHLRRPRPRPQRPHAPLHVTWFAAPVRLAPLTAAARWRSRRRDTVRCAGEADAATRFAARWRSRRRGTVRCAGEAGSAPRRLLAGAPDAATRRRLLAGAPDAATRFAARWALPTPRHGSLLAGAPDAAARFRCAGEAGSAHGGAQSFYGAVSTLAGNQPLGRSLIFQVRTWSRTVSTGLPRRGSISGDFVLRAWCTAAIAAPSLSTSTSAMPWAKGS